jgi:hypothetical protein
MTLVFLANVLLSLGICVFYGHPIEGVQTLWLGCAAVSTMTMLSLVFYLCGFPVFWASRRIAPRAAAWIEAGAWTSFHFILFIDTRIWAIFRYHINGMVWNLVTTPGGLQTFDLDAETVALVIFGTIAMFGVQMPRIGGRASNQPPPANHPKMYPHRSMVRPPKMVEKRASGGGV